MKRRQVLRATGAAGIASFGGLGAYSLMAESARAETNSDVSTTLTGESDSGIVEEIELWTTGSVEWAGLDAVASYYDVYLEVIGPEGNYQELDHVRFDNPPAVTSTDEPASYEGVGGPLFENTDWEPEDFSATEDGGTRKTTIDARVRVVVCASDGETLETENEHTVGIEISNIDENVDLDSTVGGNVTMNDTPRHGNETCGKDC